MRGIRRPISNGKNPFSESIHNRSREPGASVFIGALLPYVQSAEDWGANKPARMLNIGLTYNGIKQFEPTLAAQFPYEFKVGPWSQGSQGSLADTGSSDPSLWWNGQDKTAIHCIVHIYGMTA